MKCSNPVAVLSGSRTVVRWLCGQITPAGWSSQRWLCVMLSVSLVSSVSWGSENTPRPELTSGFLSVLLPAGFYIVINVVQPEFQCFCIQCSSLNQSLCLISSKTALRWDTNPFSSVAFDTRCSSDWWALLSEFFYPSFSMALCLPQGFTPGRQNAGYV